MPEKRKIHIVLYMLLAVSLLVRGLMAGIIELGNDEVYYWTYARYPDLSHFDHPPMVGWVIQIFTLDLTLQNDFFIRLAPVVFGTLSTGLMFLIGKQVKNELTGLYAALLFTASFYGFVLSGTFILPDTPQVFFWLLTLWLLTGSLVGSPANSAAKTRLFYAGIAAGLAFLSKYHAVFLVAGAGAYLIFHNRAWFRKRVLYLAFICFLLLTLPVVFWNIDHDFISFTFHENRVSITESGFQPQFLLTELGGQFFYNNPINVILIILALVALFNKENYLDKGQTWLILWLSVPLILVFTGFSFFRATLPHWSGPGYLGLLILASAWLSEPRRPHQVMKLFRWPVAAALIFLTLIVSIAIAQIKTGFIPAAAGQDVTLDMTGWHQLGEKFRESAHKDEKMGLITPGSPIITYRWFPAAHLDYYVADPAEKQLYCLGTLERIHKYHWINKIRGPLPAGSDAWYIALSNENEDVRARYGEMFSMIVPADTLEMTRGGKVVKKAFLYRLIGLNQPLEFE
jgi:hypothetical protein